MESKQAQHGDWTTDQRLSGGPRKQATRVYRPAARATRREPALSGPPDQSTVDFLRFEARGTIVPGGSRKSTVSKRLLTAQEYLEIERKAESRSEFYRGEVFAISGASWEHTLIKDNLAGEARDQLKNGPCRVVTSDLRVTIPATGLYTYPDAVIVCGQPQFEDEAFDTLLNPQVVIEVLSESTERYDRG